MNDIIYALGILTLVSLAIPFLFIILLLVIWIVDKILNKKGNSSTTKQ